MSSEFHGHGLEGTETQEEIKQADTSTTQSQASTSHSEVLLDIRDQELLDYLGRLQEVLPATERQRVWPNGKKRVEIKRIPDIMKRNVNFEKYFKPKNWEIGPIHSPYRYHYRDIKLKLAALFISETGSAREVILKDFKGKMNGIRACFDENIICFIEDEELMRFLFMDGCSILGFILCHMNQRLNEVGISDAEAADIVQDLLLLENQIPFQVLEVLMGFGIGRRREIVKDSLFRFVFLVSNATFPRDFFEVFYTNNFEYGLFPLWIKNEKPVHLLHLFREALLHDYFSFDLCEYLLTLIRGIFWILCSCGCVAICYFLDRFTQEPYYTTSLRMTKQFFQSVQELKAAGIKFKPSHSLATISFRSRFYFRPQLMLPTLIVDDSTAYKLLNLVAYEMCLSESNPNEKPWVSSYVNLLDSLVDNEQDIKDLRAADILRNTLSTDTLAAELINEVGTGCIAPTKDAYIDVRKKIGKYYRKTCSIWMAQVCNAHFSSPWTIMALFAATAVLVLTAIQTWFAVNPKK